MENHNFTMEKHNFSWEKTPFYYRKSHFYYRKSPFYYGKNGGFLHPNSSPWAPGRSLRPTVSSTRSRTSSRKSSKRFTSGWDTSASVWHQPKYDGLYSDAQIYKNSTSSTAQGGGGSFKNRKPIGEVGCCESGMAERSH